jgi:hypothetical protein
VKPKLKEVGEVTRLTKEDLELLIEAVDCWPRRKESGRLLSEFAMVMLTGPEKKEYVEARLEEERIKDKQRIREDEELATILKAKLILMKQETEG